MAWKLTKRTMTNTNRKHFHDYKGAMSSTYSRRGLCHISWKCPNLCVSAPPTHPPSSVEISLLVILLTDKPTGGVRTNFSAEAKLHLVDSVDWRTLAWYTISLTYLLYSRYTRVTYVEVCMCSQLHSESTSVTPTHLMSTVLNLLTCCFLLLRQVCHIVTVSRCNSNKINFQLFNSLLNVPNITGRLCEQNENM